MIKTPVWIETESLAVVVFIAHWCPYSLLVRPAAEKVSKRIGCPIRLIDIETEPGCARDCGIETVPTVLLSQLGEFVGRWEGQTNPEDIPEFFANICLTNEIPLLGKL